MPTTAMLPAVGKSSLHGPIAGRRWACVLLLGWVGSLPATLAADTPTGGAQGTRAFILSNVYVGTPPENGACKTLTPGAPELFLKSLPAEEQRDYAKPDQAGRLFAMMQARLGFKWLQMVPRAQAGDPMQKRGHWEQLLVDVDPSTARIDDVRAAAGIAAGKGAIVFNHHIVAYDSCTDPQDFSQLNQGFQPYDGQLAFGMNLDGRRGRDQFTSPQGEKGVDNQLWRVLGCMKHFREFGNPENADTTLFSVAAPTLIEVTGVDNSNGDAAVEVAVYASADPLVIDGRGRPLASMSYTADARPALIARTHGRIAGGVLITEPFDLQLRYKEQITDGTRKLRGARIRAQLNPDGSIQGGFYGYYILDSFYDSIKQMSQLGANLSSLSCPSIHAALQRFADGYPDPDSGRPTAISAALNFVGVSAFVIQPSAAVANAHDAH